MKKIGIKTALLSTLVALFATINASAAGIGNVLTLEASQDASTGEITFSGTTELSVLAASCSLLDSSDTEVFFGSVVVESSAFSGSFTVPVADYTLKCASYEGGTWVSATITAPEETPEEPEETNETDSPATGQMTNNEGASANSNSLVLWIVGGIGAIAVIAVGVVMSIKRKKSA